MKIPLVFGLIVAATAPLTVLASTPSSATRASLAWGGQNWTRGPSPYGVAAGFHVEGEVLVVAETATGEGGIVWLEGEHSAFTLTLKVMAEQPADGGIYVGADERGRGYQVRLDNWEREGNIGGIYCDGVPGGIVARTGCFAEPWHPGVWNDLKISVSRLPREGVAVTRIEVWINGTQVTAYEASAATPGARIGVQLHSNIQHDHHTPGKKIYLKDFVIVETDATRKRAAQKTELSREVGEGREGGTSFPL